MSERSRSFYALVSIWNHKKEDQILPDKQSESFAVERNDNKYFIEPTFTIEEAKSESPRIILISAIGASGKSTLAKELSYKSKSIVLDLAKHDAVGSNSLTGLLTHDAFEPQNISTVFEGLKKGTMGVIIDGIDEGKSKTAPQAFSAFLDDIAKLCGTTDGATSFIILGRSNVVDDCFIYFYDKGIDVTLWQLAPFDMIQAQKYIDKHQSENIKKNENYKIVCKAIFDGLENALKQSDRDNRDEILRFLGYAPVLDTISDIIKNNENLYALRKELENDGIRDEMILCTILDFLMRREKLKIKDNFIAPNKVALENTEDGDFEILLYSQLEQSHRLVSFCGNEQPPSKKALKDTHLNQIYERCLYENGFLQEHPFLNGKKFRNQVFESYVIAKIMLSDDLKAKDSVRAYLRGHSPSCYLIIFMLQFFKTGQEIIIPLDLIQFIIQAALELETRKSFVDIDICGSDTSDCESDITVSIDVGSNRFAGCNADSDKKEIPCEINHRHCLNLRCCADDEIIFLGNTLRNITVDLPKNRIRLGDGASSLRITPPIDIEAKAIQIFAEKLEILNTEKSSVASIQANEIDVQLNDTNGITNLDLLQIAYPGKLVYPLNQCLNKFIIPDGDVHREHALRLRKILMLFRSHSKGAMARYCDKIDHRRVLKGEWDKLLLRKLLQDSILYKHGNFYYINPVKVDLYLEVNWEQLRRGDLSEKFINYVNRI